MVEVGARPVVGRDPQRGRGTARRPAREPWFRTGGWYYLVVLFSLGTLAAVPFWYAAVRTRRRWLFWSAALYTVAGVALLALTSSTPRDAAGFPVGRWGESLSAAFSTGALLLMAVACVHLHWVRRAVWGAPVPDPEG